MTAQPLNALAAPANTCAGIGIAHGTFGELLQGVLPGGREFLVTLPITLATVAEFWPDWTSDELLVRPAHKWKARMLAQRALARLDYRCGGTLQLTSAIPEGKGLASSSADMVASARAIGEAFGHRHTEAEIESMIRGIEPSDGVMYPEIVSFYHCEVRLRERLGQLPPLTIVAHDLGGIVDTVQFHRQPKTFTSADRQEYRRLLDELGEAVRTADLATVGRVSTRSAELNLRFLPRGDFDRLAGICRDVGGLGLIQAHSGTCLGILLPEGIAGYRERIEWISRACGDLDGVIRQFHSIGSVQRDEVPALSRADALSGDIR